jgi:hypothetical protein
MLPPNLKRQLSDEARRQIQTAMNIGDADASTAGESVAMSHLTTRHRFENGATDQTRGTTDQTTGRPQFPGTMFAEDEIACMEATYDGNLTVEADGSIRLQIDSSVGIHFSMTGPRLQVKVLGSGANVAGLQILMDQSLITADVSEAGVLLLLAEEARGYIEDAGANPSTWAPAAANGASTGSDGASAGGGVGVGRSTIGIGAGGAGAGGGGSSGSKAAKAVAQKSAKNAKAASKAKASAMRSRKAALRQAPKLLVLVGLPGSGKSSFAAALQASSAGGWERVSQDDLGSRGACEAMLGRATKGFANGKNAGGKGPSHVMLDRCNCTKAERKQWLSVAFNPAPKDGE